MKQQLREKEGLSGIVTVTNYVVEGNERAEQINAQLSSANLLPPKIYNELVAELQSICTFKKVVRKNRVHLGGREMFAKILLNEPSFTGQITHGALGSSSAVINDTDTQLTAEVARKLVASKSRSSDTITIDFYFSKSDTNGTYNEFGCFIDATATANSGLMYNRVLTGGWVKSATESMTVSIQFDINAS